MSRFWWTFVPMTACTAIGAGLLTLGVPRTLAVFVAVFLATLAGYMEGAESR